MRKTKQNQLNKMSAYYTKYAQHTGTKGITLVSLVITIIVLLVLAGVAINMAINSEGIFAKAGEATEEWNTAVGREEESLQGTINTLEEQTREKTLVELYELGELNIGDYVEYNPIATGDTGTENKYTYTVLNENVGYTAKKTEEVSSINDMTIATLENRNADARLTIASSINMPDDVEVMLTAVAAPPTIPEEQIYSVNTGTKWRILGVEGDGSNKHILLISADSIKNVDDTVQYFGMGGANAYVNGPTQLNNICEIYGYGDGATGARSITIEDINKVTGVTVSSTGLTPDVDEETTYGTSYSFGDAYTPESWLGEQTKTTVSGICNSYCYNGLSEGLQTNETTNPETGTKIYDMIFGGTDAKEYWLASCGIMKDSYGAGFGPGRVKEGTVDNCTWLFASRPMEQGKFSGVRPVVELVPGATKSTVKIVEE